MKFYLRMDGVNLANFVDDTQDLSTVRGGSLLLLGAVDEVLKVSSARLDRVTTGASSGLYQFEATDDAAGEMVRKEVEGILSTHPQLKHATVVVDIQPAGEDFVRDREVLLARNRWRQMRQLTVAVPAWNTQGDVTEACEVDRVRPATSSRPAPGPNMEQVSASVRVRREFGREQKQRFYGNQTGIGMGWHFVQDFNELTDDSARGNLRHKMAVIYLDGNSFGKLQNEQCTTAEKQREFDSTIKDYRRGLLATLLQSMNHDKKNWISQADRYRLETLLWGGDEIIWVVPAWQGWKTLALFYEKSRNWQFAGERLTHAAGMVFCHHNAPIHRITALARDLAGLAKEKCRKKNLFGYLVLESFDHVGRDLKKFLAERYGESEQLVLAGDSMGKATDVLPRFKEIFPRRQLLRIVQQLRKQPQAAEQFMQEATKNLEVQGALEPLKDCFADTPTLWLHIAELWDYVGSVSS